MESRLFKLKNDWFVEEGVECAICNSKLDKIGMVTLEWGRIRSQMRFFCHRCYDKPNIKAEIVERVPVCVGDIPKNARPYFPKPPSTRSGYEVSVFDVAEIDKMGGETVDKTVYANREVEKVDKPQLDYDDDEILSIDDIDGYLLGMRPERDE